MIASFNVKCALSARGKKLILLLLRKIETAACVTAFFGLVFPGSFSAGLPINETGPATIPDSIVADWKAQDGTNYALLISSIRDSLPQEYQAHLTVDTGEAGYIEVCHWRRVCRIKPFASQLGKIIYARHHDIGGAIIGYTEELKYDSCRGLGPWGYSMSTSTDYTSGTANGTALHLIEFKDYYPLPTTVLSDNQGVLRDPAVSYDGKRITFAWSKDRNGYHLHELSLDNPSMQRQLTDDPPGLTVSDFEPCYLPNGDIMFNSSRNFGTVTCNINLTSNLFLINKDGNFLRRIGYDQNHTFYPTMMDDGTVLYTRWEYMDRNVANCFGIFRMHIDGSHQEEYFGNQTSFPSTFPQARQIPGTNKVMAIIGGHMGPYASDLVIIDRDIAQNGRSAIALIAPRRILTINTGEMDGMQTNENKLFQNPYPLDSTWFLISYRKTRTSKFRIYLMNVNGKRELLAWDASQSVSQPIPVFERPVPKVPQYQSDYSKTAASYSVNNVYSGAGTLGLEPGTIKKIRVIALEYQTDPAFGNTGSQSYQMTPVGRYGCSWNAKRIVGEIPVAADGSAAFIVPARRPIYFQLIAADGTMIQTMRSWSTLMPGEHFACIGCHDSTSTYVTSTAGEPKTLQPFFDIKDDYLYFPKHIQPILDRNCVKSGCHDSENDTLDLTGEKLWTGDLTDADNKNAYRFWLRSYLNLSNKKYCSYNAIFDIAEGIKPKSLGSSKSKVITQLLAGHHDAALTKEEIGKLCAWIDLAVPHSGKFTDDMAPADSLRYEARLDRRREHEQLEAQNITAFVAAGGYGTPEYQQTGIARIGNTGESQKVPQLDGQLFSVRFSPTSRFLSIKLPSEGTISLVDLRGRLVYSQWISRTTFLQNSTVNISVKFPSGVYIIRIIAPSLTSERVVSVFE